MPRNREKAQVKLLLIPLGGLGEIGKNSLAMQYGDDIIVIDAGLAFPEEEMLGIDIVIPDFTYLMEHRDKVRGVIITHGHEDHTGALPYLLKELDVPLYSTRLTLGLIEGKLEEAGMVMNRASQAVKPGESITIGCFAVDFFRVNHSIADAVGLAIRTPVGTIVHTGDFKFDQTPVDGEVTDFHKLTQLGREGVLALLSDSTNSERPGFTPSERVVGRTLDEVFRVAKQRVLVASFASNVHRIQQVIDAAHKHNRKVTVVGRSMENTVEVAMKLGYLKAPDGCIVQVDEIRRFSANQIAILTTGSQGEPMSALTRMSNADHKLIEIVPGDTVVIAATAVPGNEKSVARTINNLFRRGAEVIYESRSGVHVSGHASQEELKMMLNLIRPKFFVPVHGEYRHLVHHARLAEGMGIPRANVFIAENGGILEFTAQTGTIAGKVTSGQVLVDGLGVGDVGNIVLRDRKQLSQDGILIVVVALEKNTGMLVGGPDIVSRGFVYVRESESLLDEAKERVKSALEDVDERRVTEWAVIKSTVRDSLGKFLYERTRRRPMILPIIIEV